VDITLLTSWNKLHGVGPAQPIDLAIEDCINSEMSRLRARFFEVKRTL